MMAMAQRDMPDDKEEMDEMGFDFRGGRWMPTTMTMNNGWHV